MEKPKKLKFEVTLVNTVVTESILLVEATSEKEATQIAEKLAEGDWEDIGKDYEVLSEDTTEDKIDVEMVDNVTPHSAYS